MVDHHGDDQSEQTAAGSEAVDHADTRYLDAKRTVDDRALDRRVRDRLVATLPAAPTVREAGPGTGTTVPRLWEWGVTAGDYRGVDRSADLVAYARERRCADLDGAATPDGFRVGDLDVRFVQGDALTAFEAGVADLLVAASFLDLVDLETALDAFERALAPGGLLYAPFTFDGATLFRPPHPDDDAVTTAFHESLDAGPGTVRAGRAAVDSLERRAGTLVAVGASDWVVRPRGGTYPADEAYFLSCILDFVAGAVGEEYPDWCSTRRDQLADGELWYLAHQYDLLYRAP